MPGDVAAGRQRLREKDSGVLLEADATMPEKQTVQGRIDRKELSFGERSTKKANSGEVQLMMYWVGSYQWVQHGASDRSIFVAPPQFDKGQKGRSALPASKGSNCCASLFPQQSTVDKLIKKTNLALVVGTHSWRDQFLEAITVSAGEREISNPIPASPGHVQPGMRCV